MAGFISSTVCIYDFRHIGPTILGPKPLGGSPHTSTLVVEVQALWSMRFIMAWV